MKVYGLVGRNIGYSLSPYMHNAAFKALNLDSEYRIFDTAENELGNLFLDLRNGTISGCNVTIPYKERALTFVDRCDGVAEDIGAINTITLRDDLLIGYNTDYQGFIETLTGKRAGDLGFDSREKSVFVFGAGGASRAVIYGLMSLGAKRIAVADIDMDKGESLASSIINRHQGDSIITVVKDETKYEEFISKSDLLVNATPCGIKDTDPDLFDYRHIHERLHIIDLIYAKETPLVKEAKSQGARAVNGINMLLYQAAAAFEIWTNLAAPVDIMKKALLERIA